MALAHTYAPKSDTFLMAATITPHDSNLFLAEANGFYVGTTGTATVVLVDGTTQLFSGLPAGSIVRLRIKGVRATGTTATNLVALY